MSLTERQKDEIAHNKDRAKASIYENKICAAVGQQLVLHYPKWKWWVECRLDTGFIIVRNLSLRGDYGFYIPIAKFINETDPKIVKMAAGEILERYSVHRGAMPENLDVKRDFTGGAIGDL